MDAAPEPLVLVDDEGDGDTGGADLPGELHGGLQLRSIGGAGGERIECGGEPVKMATLRGISALAITQLYAP
ncbi:hypothetical protein GCM10010294_60730 [Streptomyces griseoloalbus]|nr:hypothetical protein GCM10010294_60730 [Streptomyces griseoloalbus]